MLVYYLNWSYTSELTTKKSIYFVFTRHEVISKNFYNNTRVTYDITTKTLPKTTAVLWAIYWSSTGTVTESHSW